MRYEISSDPEDGYWWMPGREDLKIPGRLSMRGKSGALLSLNGSFFEFGPVLSGTASSYLTEIFGYLKSGKEVTCFACVRSDYNFRSNGYFSETFNVTICVFGGHFIRNNMRVKRISVECDNLFNWAGFGMISNEDPLKNDGFFLKWNRGIPSRGVVTRDYTIKFIETFSQEGMSSQDTTIRKRIFASIFLSGDMDLIESLNFAHTLISRLLSIACQKYCDANVLSVDFINRFTAEIFEDNFLYKERVPILNAVIRPQMLFSLDDCESLYFWELYIKSKRKYSVIYALFFELYMEKSRRTFEAKFLYLVRALEAFHRRYFDMESERKAHIRKLEMICEKIEDKESAKYIYKRLRNGHEPPLERKILDIVNIFPKSVGDLIVTMFGKETWSDINGIRNYYAHFPEAREPGSVRVAHLNRVMEFLVICSMLKIIGFSAEWIEKKVLEKRIVLPKDEFFEL
jgi:hypothetical protein